MGGTNVTFHNVIGIKLIRRFQEKTGSHVIRFNIWQKGNTLPSEITIFSEKEIEIEEVIE